MIRRRKKTVLILTISRPLTSTIFLLKKIIANPVQIIEWLQIKIAQTSKQNIVTSFDVRSWGMWNQYISRRFSAFHSPVSLELFFKQYEYFHSDHKPLIIRFQKVLQRSCQKLLETFEWISWDHLEIYCFFLRLYSRYQYTF